MTTLEDISSFLYKSIENKKCSVSQLKKISSYEYDCILSPLDNSFIEQKYTEIVLELGMRECETKIKIKLKELTDSSQLLNLISDFHQISNFENFPTFLRNSFYDLIQRDRKYFKDEDLVVAFNKLTIFLKSEIKNKQEDVKIEFEFLERLILVFRESFVSFKELLIDLKLKEFADGKISLENVAKLIASKKIEIKFYDELQSLAKKLVQNDSVVLEKFIRDEVLPFTKPVEIEEINNSVENEKKILKFTKKIMFIEDLHKFFITDYQYDEIQIVADTLHITKNLFSSNSENIFNFNGANLVIIANTVKVHNEVKFDFSGKNGEVEVLASDAGRDSSGKGLDGKDGNAGENGGCCAIECTAIENPKSLKIISFGGDGTKGQNGGNGTDGVNGRNAEESDFKINGDEFLIQTSGAKRIRWLKKFDDTSRINWASHGDCFEDDGLNKHVYIYSKMTANGLMLVKGTDGTAGKIGGLSGFGGEGGYPGEILIKTSDNSGHQVMTETRSGRSGMNGIAGYNGLNGKDGRDAWIYDQNNWFTPEYGGRLTMYKYEIAFSSSSRDNSVWNESKNSYAYAKRLSEVKAVNTNRCRNESSNVRSRAAHSMAKKKQAISTKVSNGMTYLRGSIDRVKSEVSRYDGISLETEVGKITSKVSVKMTYQVTHEKISRKKYDAINGVKLTFLDVKRKFQREQMTFEDFWRTLRTVDLNSKQCFELKNAIENNKDFLIDTDEFYDAITDAEMNELETMKKNQPFFVYYHLRNDFEVNDAIRLLNEKLVLVTYEDFIKIKLAELNNESVTHARKGNATSVESPHSTSKNLSTELKIPNDISQLVIYLEEAENLEIQTIDQKMNFERFQDYFNKDSSLNREQMRNYYSELKKKSMDLFDHSINFKNLINSGKKLIDLDTKEQVEKATRNANFFMAIIEILFRYKSELTSLQEELRQFEDEYKSMKNIHATNVQLENKFQNEKEVQIFIKKFFDNKEIATFVENNLISHGITSPIYRRLIEFAFEVHLMIFIKRIDGSLALIDNDKTFDDEKTATGRKKSKESSENVHLLMKEDTFTLLKFNKEIYRRDKDRESLTNKMRKWNSEWKTMDLTGKYYSFDKIVLNSNENTEGFIRKLLTYFPVATQTAIKELESTLSDINYVSGSSVIKSVNLRLFHEENLMDIKEFTIIMTTVLDLISEHSFMIEYFAIKFLSMKHTDWIIEIILLQTENHLESVEPNLINSWRKCLNNVSSREILLLFLNKVEQLAQLELTEAEFTTIIGNMQYFSKGNYQNLIEIQLVTWMSVVTTDYWFKYYKFLSQNDVTIINGMQSKYGSEKLKDLLNIMNENSSDLTSLKTNEFLGNFNSGEWIFSKDVFDVLKKNKVKDWMELLKTEYEVGEGQRSVTKIVELVKVNPDTSKVIKGKIGDIERQAKHVSHLLNTTFINFSDNDVKEWLKNYVPTKEPIIERLAIISRIFQLKLKYPLRHTQILSILTLWHNERGVLIQIGTGEGKTFIGIAFAILKHLNNERVDIITSSKVLAERDATAKDNLEVFKVFGISVDHNCYEDIDTRRQVYDKSQVIYGILNNFQRDYLLTQFYNQNLLNCHHFKNVIVDEVDSMLLDKGNNILYLSQELPDIDEVVSVFTFIWQWVNQETDNQEQMLQLLKSDNIRRAVLDNCYGVVDEYEVEKMLGDDSNVDCDSILSNLKSCGIIDEECVLIVKELKDNSIQFPSINLQPNVVTNLRFYINEKLASPKIIKFPQYLKKFVMFHLDKWIGSAISALIMEDGREYVIDRCREGGSVQMDPNIVIVDIDTGTDQKNSQWDEGLCQFLQLKHGCKLSLIGLKSVFISNVSYFKKYTKLYGMSGTLGTLSERNKLTEFYDLDYVTIPTYLPRKFMEQEAILLRSSDEWLKMIMDEVKSMFNQGRSVLVICKTIRDIQVVQNAIEVDNGGHFDKSNILIYQRDYEDLNIDLLRPKTLIIATNLAGRGTDIKLSPELNSSGGLHIILTYLPTNVRIENQAFGRSARAGSRGSARLIIRETTKESIDYQKYERDQNELVRLDAVSDYYKNFIVIEEQLFSKFLEAYKDYSKKITENEHLYKKPDIVDEVQVAYGGTEVSACINAPGKLINGIFSYFGTNTFEEAREILLENFKISWSLWLDEHSEQLRNWRRDDNKNLIKKSFDEFTSKSAKCHYDELTLHPVSRLKLFKYFDRIGRIEDAHKVIIKSSPSDSIAYEYYKNYIEIKLKSKSVEFVRRDLTSDEAIHLRLTMKNLADRDLQRSSRSCAIKALKEKYRRTLIPIHGFENQEKSLIEIESVFGDSISKLLGKGVTTDTFNSPPFGNDIFNEQFYQFLLIGGYITRPRVSSTINELEVAKIAQKYALNATECHNFLENNKSNAIESFDEFSQNINKFVKFPTRECFWQILVEKNFLTNEVEYAIINLQLLRDFHPLEADKILKQLEKFKINELKVDNNFEIFLHSVVEDNEILKQIDGNRKIVVPLKAINSVMNFEGFLQYIRCEFISQNDFLCFKKNAITSNRKAMFDMNKYAELESDFIFENFDEISKKDFIQLSSNQSIRDQIIKELIGQEILLPKGDLKFLFNYKHVANLNLRENFMYETKVIELLSLKFPFRIALAILVKQIIENQKSNQTSQNINIHLFPNPQMMIIHDMLMGNLIELSKVNRTTITNLEDDEIFKKFMGRVDILKLFKLNGLPQNDDFDELIDELIEKKILFQIRLDHATSDGIKSLIGAGEKVLSFPGEFLNKITFSILSPNHNYSKLPIDDTTVEKSKKENVEIDKKSKEKNLAIEYLKYIQEEYTKFTNPNNILLNPIVITEYKGRLSKKFEYIEETVKLILERKRLLLEIKSEIIKTLKNHIDVLQSDICEFPELILVPLETLNPHIDYELLNFMQLKGLEVVIQVQEKSYSLTYFIRVASVILIGLAQIVIGIAITILSKGILINVGSSVSGEGMGDIIFALCTLRNGHFRWSDYKSHKITSVLTTAATFGITLGLSKVKCLEKYFRMTSKTFGEKVAGKGFCGMSGLDMWHQGGEIRQVALKNMWKVLAKEAAISGAKAFSMAGVSVGVDYLVEQQLDSITSQLSNMLTDLIQGDFEKHDLSKTITELLKVYTTGDLKKLIDSKFKEIAETNDSFRQTWTTIGSKIDTIIQSGHGINTIVSAFSTIAVKSIALGSMAYDTATSLNKLNVELKNEKLTRREDENEITIDDKSRNEFKRKVLEDIQLHLAQQLKVTINQNVIAPSLKYIANHAVNAAASAVVNFAKSIQRNRDEIRYAKEAAQVELELQGFQDMSQLTEDEKLQKENLVKKAKSIKSKTLSPETYSKLSKLDLPMGDVEIEAAARNRNITIVVEHDGIKHKFGNGQKVVEINLKDGHFPNSSDGTLTLTNDCLYQKLNDKMNIASSITPEQFRNEIANTIVNDPQVREFVADPRRKFFHDIGFYGGKEKQKKESGRLDVKKTEGDAYTNFINEKVDMQFKKPVAVDKNVDIRDKERNGNPKDLNETEYNEKRNEGIHEGIDKINDVLKEINPGLKVTLNDFEAKNFAEIRTNIEGIDTALFPVEMQIDQQVLQEKIKDLKLPKHDEQKLLNRLKSIEINIDYPQAGDNGPNVGHVGVTIISDFNREKVDKKSNFHILIGDLSEPNKFPPPTRTKTGMVSANDAKEQNWDCFDHRKIFLRGTEFSKSEIVTGGGYNPKNLPNDKNYFTKKSS